MTRERTNVFAAFDDQGLPHIIYEFAERDSDSGGQKTYELARGGAQIDKISETEFLIIGTGEKLHT